MTPKLIAVAFAATAMMAVPFAAMAEEAPRPRITVTGEGEASAAPDTAVLSLVVLQEKPTAREALTANNDTMAKVLDAMKKAGIAERDLQTSGFSIDPRYVYPENKNGQQPQAPKIVGYAVSNSLSVRVRDLKKVGEILDQSVTLGVNQGGNLTFTNDKPDTIIEEARKKAVANAIAKAKTLTEAAGVEVGKVIEISEQSFQPRPYAAGAPRVKMMAAEASDSVPVAAGENSYNVTVNVTFELKN
ncbi:SIMPL domain-containing protein [Phyllobacterium sp. 628]|uniref:SIMPL domain-containing protein n=1 Tax=Phyllobacterium sp. 628 TaxID=2718938 RepID=UPI0016621F07|nr:SIMPL domain-containing protein [Phyllobacterium sp. 628]QND53734.1 SIMPL domain-containing protein [Phyllobacterium sp. 628]